MDALDYAAREIAKKQQEQTVPVTAVQEPVTQEAAVQVPPVPGQAEPVTAPVEPVAPTAPVTVPQEPTTPVEPVIDESALDLDLDNLLKEIEDSASVRTAETNPVAAASEPAQEPASDADDTKIEKGLDKEKGNTTIKGKLQEEITHKEVAYQKLEHKYQVETELLKEQLDSSKRRANEYYEKLNDAERANKKFANRSVPTGLADLVDSFKLYEEADDKLYNQHQLVKNSMKIIEKVTGRSLDNYIMDRFSK